MKIRVIDFETTDKVEEKAKGKGVGVIEIGWTDVDGGTGAVSKPESRLVNPGLPISPEARGVHHISEGMLDGALYPEEAFQILMAGMEPGDLFCAHKADFEQTFFAGGAHAWICTMICAKHLWEDAPSYSNQTLRYWLGIEDELEWPDLAMPPHRAAPDAYITAHILSRMILMKHPSTLVQLTNTMVLQKTVRFGENYGRPWSDMDFGFLDWCVNKARHIDAESKHAARHWLNQRSLSGTPFA